MSDAAAIRPPVCAGRFYPADSGALRRMVQGFLDAGFRPKTGRFKAIVAPHAGYVFSGPIAGSAYGAFAADRTEIRRVVLAGPAHYREFSGIALAQYEAFHTPLGTVSVDGSAIDLMTDLPQVRLSNAPHEPEHCLEVQLPFLQQLLETEFTIVPLLVGSVDDEEISAVLDRLWGGPETRLVVSSDLSHYHGYREAQVYDRETAAALEKLAIDPLDSDHACGYKPLRGLLRSARRHGLECTTLDLRNSGDTAGPRDRVVGYGGFGFAEG